MLSHLFHDRRRTRKKKFCPEKSFLTTFRRPLFVLKELTINPLYRVKLSKRSLQHLRRRRNNNYNTCDLYVRRGKQTTYGRQLLK